MTEPCATGFCGTGGWAGPLPGDPGNVFGLSAVSAFGGIDLSWNLPSLNPFAVAYTSVYRGTTANFATALKLVDWGGSRYFDQTAAGETPTLYYYWVRQVSVNGTLGELVGPASALAKPTIRQMLELLAAQIDDSHLAQSLKAEIGRIQLLDTQLADEILARLAGNQALQNALAAVSNELGTAVTLITEETYARTTQNSAVVGTINTLAAGVAGNAAAIVDERNIRVTNEGATATQVNTLFTRTGANESAIIAERNARTTALESIAEDILSLVATTNNAATSAALQEEREVRATAVSAVAQSVTQLQAKVGDDIGAAVQGVTTAFSTADAALGQRIDTVQATLGAGANLVQNSSFEFDTNNDGLPDAWNIHRPGTQAGPVCARVANTSVHGDFVLRLAWTSAGAGGQNGIYQTVRVGTGATHMVLSASVAGTAGLTTRLYINFHNVAGDFLAQTTEPFALTGSGSWARRSIRGAIPAGTSFCNVFVVMEGITGAGELLVDAVQFQSNQLTSYTPAPDYAVLQSEITARISATGALSSRMDQAEVNFNGNVAQATAGLSATVSTINGKVTEIGAQWTAKVNVNGLIGGFGVYNSGQEVVAGFDVDNFWIGRTVMKVKPFVITDGVVYINKAAVGRLDADQIDTRGLDIRDASGNIVFSSGVPLGVGNASSGLRNDQISVSNGQLLGIGSGGGAQVDNSYVAVGKNMISNSDQTSSMTMAIGWNPNGAVIDQPLKYASDYWTDTYTMRYGSTRNVAVMQGPPVAGGNTNIGFDIYPNGGSDVNRCPVVPGQRYIFSVYVQGHRTNYRVGIAFMDQWGNNIAEVGSTDFVGGNGAADKLSAYERAHVVGTAPAGAATALPYIRKLNTYVGEANSWIWLAAPQFEAAAANQSTPSPYSPGPVGKVNQLGYTGDLNATVGAPSNTYVGSTLAQTLEQTANSAAAQAAVSTAALNAIANDAILSKGEKSAVIQEWQTLSTEKPGIISQGETYKLSTTAYSNAVDAVANMLNGIGAYAGDWANVNSDSSLAAIGGGDGFRTAWVNAYAARQALLNAAYAAQSKVSLSRPNILPNGGFERGLVGWNNTPGKELSISDGVWGRIAISTNPGNGTGVLQSNQFPVFPNVPYTISGDSVIFASDSHGCYFDLVFYAANGSTIVLDGPQNAVNGTHDFNVDDSNRRTHAVEAVAPANAVYAMARFVWYGNNITAVGCRQIKVERGGLPATSYSSEAALTAAQADATAANTVLANIASDDVLSRGEKPEANLKWTAIANEQTDLNSQANSYSITTERDVYNTAVTNLSAYLSSLSPLWYDVAVDTPIVGTTFRQKYVDVYVSKQALINKIAAVAGTRSTWTGTSSKPADSQIYNSYLPIGQNLIPNSDQTVKRSWVLGYAGNGSIIDKCELADESGYGWTKANHVLAGGNTRNLVVHQANTTTLNQDGSGNSAQAADIYPMGTEGRVACVPGDRFCFSVYAAAHRCNAQTWIGFFDAAGNVLQYHYVAVVALPGGYTNTLEQYSRIFNVVNAPAGAAQANCFVRKYNTTAGTPYPDSFLWLAAPQFEKLSANATEPSPYQPGPTNGIGQLGYTGALNATYGADWNTAGSVANRPADTSIYNNQINITGGQLFGIGGGAGTAVANTAIAVSDGKISGIGSGDGVVVDNTHVIDSIIPDPRFKNPGWWGAAGANWTSVGVTPAANASTTNGKPLYYLIQYATSGAVEYWSGYMQVEKGATYRLRTRIWVSPDAAGVFWAGLHYPADLWFTALPYNTYSSPEGGINLSTVRTKMGGNWTEYTETRIVAASNSFQFRTRAALTSGYVEFAHELTRVFSLDSTKEVVGQIRASNATTWIENGAIGTAQVGQLFAENITVAQLSRSVQGLSASYGRIELDANRVRVFDSSNNVRVKLGYLP